MIRNESHPAVGKCVGHSLAAIGAFAAFAFAACPASAQAPGSSLATSYSANADKPINIEADALEVDDKTKVATFKGNVSATQGDFNIRAKEIQVLYTSAPKKDPAAPKKDPAEAASADAAPAPANAAPPAANAALPGGANADIQRIDAKGKVLVTTKDNQTTTSDWAIFEVKKQLVTIGGDVVVTQGTDTIKGSKLVIDLTTGLSRFETAANDKDVAPGASKRLQMLITPKAREKSKTAKPDAPKPE
jgi:lipopolysaccharide export system protein LptA